MACYLGIRFFNFYSHDYYIYALGIHTQTGKERSTRLKNEGPIQAFHTIRQWPLTVICLGIHAGPSYWVMVGTVCTFYWPNTDSPAMGKYIVTGWQTAGPAFVVDWVLKYIGL